MKRFLLLFLVVLPLPAGAQRAAHLGSTLYALDPSEGGVSALDLDSGKSTPVPLKVPGGQAGIGLAVRDGKLLVLGERGIWEFDPQKEKERRLLAAPGDFSLECITHDPKSGVILVTATSSGEKDLDHEIWVLPPGGSKLAPVLVRRLAHVDGIDFLPDGRLVIASRGDLWIGRDLAPLDTDDGRVLYEMEAFRFCPMGELEAMNGTSSSTGAVQAVAVGDLLVVRVSRLGGSGYETFVTVPLPPADAEGLQSVASMAKSLGAVRNLGGGSERGVLCRDAAGTRAWLDLRPEEGEAGLHLLDGKGELTRPGLTR